MLQVEQIKQNWDNFLNIIDTHITGERKDKLLEFYKQYEDRFVLLPASHKKAYHNCFPGGYIDHVLRVIECSLKLDKIWREMGMADTYTTEELVFAAINHDLGKFGTLDQPSVFDNDNDWEIKNRGELYKFNTNITYMSVPDRSLHLLFSIGVTMTENEYIAIKTHDGMYDEANKAYLLSYMPETKPRSSLLYVLHHADMMAARIEYETEWLPKLMSGKSSKPAPKKEFTLNKSGQSAQKQKAMKSMGNENLANILKNI
jgi:hypothetical protein